MKNKMIEKDFELIERFFQLDLDEQELVDFKQRLEKDQVFHSNVEKYQLANKTAHELFLPGYHDFLEQQKKALKKIESPTNVTKRASAKWWLRIAATVTILVVAAYFLLMPNKNSLKELQSTTRSIAESSINVDALSDIGSRSTASTVIDPIVEAYQKQEFDKVVELSKSYVEQSDILLLRGLSFYKSGNSVEATQNLESLISLPSGQKDAALWWLASIYLDQGKTLEAKNYLQRIIDANYPSASKAHSILGNL